MAGKAVVDARCATRRETLIAWGVAIAVVGVLMFVAARTKSDFVVYRLLVYRSRIF